MVIQNRSHPIRTRASRHTAADQAVRFCAPLLK